MKRRLIAVGGIAILVGAYVGVDALFESDEERLEAIAQDFSGAVTSERIGQALSHFAPDLEPVEIVVRGQSRTYTDAAELSAEALRALSSSMGQSLRRLRGGVSVDGDHGRIHMQLLTSNYGTVNVVLLLERDGERWIITRLTASR